MDSPVHSVSSICGQRALGRRTTNNGRPRCFGCQATQQIDLALTAPDGRIRPELFLSPRTVGHHLYRAYPKLGVRRRAELGQLDL